MEAINGLFTNLLNNMTTIAFAVAAFFFAVGGLIYASAAGSPHQMETGKRAMINASAGLALVLAARTVMGMIQSALGGH
jgi:hypothetical protein